LRESFKAIAGRTSELKGDWSRSATGYTDWDCKDLLAHVTSTAVALPAVVASVSADSGEGRPHVAFDADRWNSSQVRRRKEVPVEQLVKELLDATQTLDATLAELDLSLKVTAGPYAGSTVDEAMADMVNHQNDHLGDLENLLA